jgi:hypothetical protein
VETTRNSIPNFVQTTASSVSRRRYGFRVGFSITIGEGYQIPKIGSEYVTLAGYIGGNPGFMKAEILLHVLIFY